MKKKNKKKMIIRRGKRRYKVRDQDKIATWQCALLFFFSFYITWRTFPLHCALSSKFIFNHNLRSSSLQVKRKTLIFFKKMAYKSLDSITRSDIKSLGISDDVSDKLLRDLEDIIRNHGSATPPERWIEISRRILHPDLPFSFHQMMYHGCYKDFGPDPPAWLPDPYVIQRITISFLCWFAFY